MIGFSTSSKYHPRQGKMIVFFSQIHTFWFLIFDKHGVRIKPNKVYVFMGHTTRVNYSRQALKQNIKYASVHLTAAKSATTRGKRRDRLWAIMERKTESLEMELRNAGSRLLLNLIISQSAWPDWGFPVNAKGNYNKTESKCIENSKECQHVKKSKCKWNV